MESGLRIPEKLFFRIGEVCDLIKVQPHVLRYWETEFPMLAPQKNRAGQRVYRRKDVEVVLRIRNLLYEEKFTIAGAKKKLLDEQHKGGPAGGGTKPKADQQAQRHAGSYATPAAQPSRTERPELGPELNEEITLFNRPPEPILVVPVSATFVGAPSPEPALPQAPAPAAQTLTPQARRALRVIKHDLEDLLTMLGSDASIKR
ncbi:MAG TPA: MerR family transcriptional regulator [Blastocatellia bacterium]|nr:MerR family transcriptional regulator [Blastocatellia bacterium]